MAKKFQPPAVAELTIAVTQFEAERPRAFAVMAAAWVDDALRAFLEKYLARDSARASSLLRPDGPLGTFGVRIQMAYLLGLIDSDLRSDLDAIREIRNEFAHVRTRVSFKTHRIAAKCNALCIVTALEGLFARTLSPRARFLCAAYVISSTLIAQAGRLKPPEPLPDMFRTFRQLSKSGAFRNLISSLEQLAADAD